MHILFLYLASLDIFSNLHFFALGIYGLKRYYFLLHMIIFFTQSWILRIEAYSMSGTYFILRLRTPNSKLQVSINEKISKKNFFPSPRFKKMNLPQDEFEEMFRLSQVLVISIWFLHTNCYFSLHSYVDLWLFTVKHRLLLVFASHEAVKYTREIFLSFFTRHLYLFSK